MLSRVLPESFFRMFPPAQLRFPELPEGHSILRRSLSQGGRQRFLSGIFAQGETCLMWTLWDRPGLTGLRRQVFRGLIVCPLCAERAALDKRRQDFIHIAALAVSHAADAARFRRRRIRVSSLIML